MPTPTYRTRRDWVEEYARRVQAGAVRTPEIGLRLPCPCCGYPTLTERRTYDICSLCNWEDDGQDEDEGDVVRGGPNGQYSLAAARENFQRHLTMWSPEEQRRGRADSARAREAKRAVIAAFDRMVAEEDEGKLEALWREVAAGEAVLRDEVRTSVARLARRPRTRR